jgi:hypothetical protein
MVSSLLSVLAAETSVDVGTMCQTTLKLGILEVSNRVMLKTLDAV